MQSLTNPKVMNDPLVEKAHKKVQAKKGFYVHLITYLSVGIFFLLMNILTFEDEWWFFFPMLPWMVGLLIHYFVVFGLPGTNILTEGWEEKEMEKELWRLRRQKGKLHHSLPGAGSTEEKEEELELPSPEELKEKRWDREDLV